MGDIGKLPGVNPLLPKKSVKPVVKKKMNENKDNRNKNSIDDEDSDDGNRHIDEYA